MGTSQFTEANSDTLLKNRKEIKVVLGIPTCVPTSSTPHFLSSYYLPGIILGGSEENVMQCPF